MDTTPPTDVATSPDTVQHGVLEIVGGLVKELRGTASPVTVAAHSSLERDLGISSLERVELLLRIERRFGVRLPEATVAAAETPADLVAALSVAAPAMPDRPPDARPAVGAAGAAPTTARHAARGSRVACPGHAGSRAHLSQRRLQRGARNHVSRTLGWREGGRGCARASAASPPATPSRSCSGPRRRSSARSPVSCSPERFRSPCIRRFARIASPNTRTGRRASCATPARVFSSRLPRRSASDRSSVAASSRYATSIAADELRSGGLGRDPIAQTTSESPALIQYTSGSTGDPKGVLLSHGNILANIRAIGQAIDVAPDDVAVSWLPLYHDMGLIGAWLGLDVLRLARLGDCRR